MAAWSVEEARADKMATQAKAGDVTLSTSFAQSNDAQVLDCDYYTEDAEDAGGAEVAAPGSPSRHAYGDVFSSPSPSRPFSSLSSPRLPTGIIDHNLDTSHESAPWFITNCIDDVSAVVLAAVTQGKPGDYLVRYSSDNTRVVVCFNDHGQEGKLQFEPAEGGYRFGDFKHQKIVDGLIALMTKGIGSFVEEGARVLLGNHADITQVLPLELAKIIAKESGPDWHWQVGMFRNPLAILAK